MPETVVTPNAAQSAAATPTGQSSSGDSSFKMPEKFANKSAEDIAKAYAELESQHGKATSELGKYKGYDDVIKLGAPKDITDAIQWARQVNVALREGKISYKQAEQLKQNGPSGDQNSNAAPWDDANFDYLTPREQAKAIADYNRSAGMTATKSYIDQIAAQYGEQIQGYNTMSQRQQNILLKAIKQAIKNPDVDPEELLTQAAELAGKGPEELLNMAMESRMAPKNMEAEIDKRVKAALAEREQERINDQAKLISSATGRRPTFANRNKTREDENKAIFEKLAKDGINLLR